MDCLIIYCHPYDKSFNHAVLENVENNLKQNKIKIPKSLLTLKCKGGKIYEVV